MTNQYLDTLMALCASCDMSGKDMATWEYARQSNLLTHDSSVMISLEGFREMTPILAYEDLQKSFLGRLKEHVHLKYMDVAARIRRKKDIAKHKKPSDADVIYPRARPDEVEPYNKTAAWLTSISNTLLSNLSESTMDTPAGFSSIVTHMESVINTDMGILPKQKLEVSGETVSFVKVSDENQDKRISEIESRVLGDSVNGWHADQVPGLYKKYQDTLDKVLYILERIVGKLNSIDYESERDTGWMNKTLMLVKRFIDFIEKNLEDYSRHLKAARLV